eukprot:4808630-Pleurochrysis_carterae.AAC.1
MENLLYLPYTKGIYDVDGKLTMIPRSYFNAVQIVEIGSQTNKSDNFYVTSEGRLIINDHKTSNVYKYSYVLPKEVQAAIHKSLKDQPREWLISKADGDRYTLSALSSLVGRVLGGMPVNCHTMENVFMDRNMPAAPLARAMGHSVDTQIKHYLKRKGALPPGTPNPQT